MIARRAGFAGLVTLIAGLAGQVAAQSAGPIMTGLYPRAAKRGSEVLLRCFGRNLRGALGIVCDQGGVEVLEVKDINVNQTTLRVRLSPELAIGAHQFRVRTKRGLSNMRLFFVSEHKDRYEDEKKNNNSRESAEKIAIGTTIHGRLQPEDVDYYRIEVPERMRIAFEVQGVRLGDRAVDPHLSVIDAKGRPIVQVDDTAFGRLDPLASKVLEKGSYWVEVRESAYGGSSGSFYRLHVGRFPRPVAAIPAGGRPGQKLNLTLLGDGERRKVEFELPKGKRGVRYFPRNEHGVAPSPLILSIVDIENYVEPIDGKPRKPIEFKAPGALNGVLLKSGERDRWRFRAKKGQRYQVQVLGRLLRSPVDPVIGVVQIGGPFRQYNDDAGHPDSRISFRVPSDGLYEVVIWDHLRRGGERFAYRIEVTRPGSQATARVLPAGRYEDHAVAVPRAGRFATRFAVGGIPIGAKLEFVGLPKGVQAHVGTRLPGSNIVPAVFEASQAAKAGGHRLAVVARVPGRKQALDVLFQQPVTLVRVRNQQPYFQIAEDRLPLAVTETAPFRIEVEQPKVPILRGGPLTLKLRVHRAKGFKSAVRARLLFNPPGIGASQVTIRGNEGSLRLNANGGAGLQTWKLAVAARFYANGSYLETSSKLFDLRVSQPWISAKIGKARAEQGKACSLKVTLGEKAPFAGKCNAKLYGLPGGVQTKFPSFDAKAQSIEFPLQIAQKARPGRHRNLLLRLEIPTPQGTVVQHLRGGEIRIDRPVSAKLRKLAGAKSKAVARGASAKKAAAKAAAKRTAKKAPAKKSVRKPPTKKVAPKKPARKTGKKAAGASR